MSEGQAVRAEKLAPAAPRRPWAPHAGLCETVLNKDGFCRLFNTRPPSLPATMQSFHQLSLPLLSSPLSEQAHNKTHSVTLYVVSFFFPFFSLAPPRHHAWHSASRRPLGDSHPSCAYLMSGGRRRAGALIEQIGRASCRDRV